MIAASVESTRGLITVMLVLDIWAVGLKLWARPVCRRFIKKVSTASSSECPSANLLKPFCEAQELRIPRLMFAQKEQADFSCLALMMAIMSCSMMV